MAADNRSITITLKLTGDDSDGSNVNSSSKTDTSSFSGEDKDTSTKAVAKALALQAATVAVNEGLAWAEYIWNKELTLNDDYIGQRNKQIAMTQINRTIGYTSQFFTAVASGAAVGQLPGALIGGLIGATSIVANIARSNAQGTIDQNILLAQTNAQLDFTRARAGWSTKAASIGEDL